MRAAVPRWLSREVSPAVVEAAWAAIIRRADSALSGQEIASFFERDIYSLLCGVPGLKLEYRRECSDAGICHVFGAAEQAETELNLLLVEYRPLLTPAAWKTACAQLICRLETLYHATKSAYDAILTDGRRMACFTFGGDKVLHTPLTALSKSGVDLLIRAILHHGTKKLLPSNLVRDFAVSPHAPSVSRAFARLLYQLLKTRISERAESLYAGWKELMHLPVTDKVRSRESEKRRRALSGILGADIDDAESECKGVFALQTTYALIVRLIACRVMEQGAGSAGREHREGAASASFCFAGDFFSWFADDSQVDERFDAALRDIIGKVSRYSAFSPGVVFAPVDVFKDLYMSMIPPPVRHSTGEYFTPGWLADRVVTEALALTGRKDWKAMDPCCGSGSFLITLIRKVVGNRPLCLLAPEERVALQRSVLERVHGVDINPLAVLSARVNYLLALLQLGPVGDVEIPVYLGDSALPGQGPDAECPSHELERCTRALAGLYVLEGAETRLPRRSSYELIVGNPPWVKWEHLPASYTQKIRECGDTRRLFCRDGGMYGGAQLNLCALVAHAVAVRWLHPKGILAFLMPDSLMSQNSYEEFRHFYVDAGKRTRLYLQKLDRWLPPLRPFKVGDEVVMQDFNTYYYGFRKQDYGKGVEVTEISRRKRVADSLMQELATFEELRPWLRFSTCMARQLSATSSAFTYDATGGAYDLITGETAYLYRTGVESTPFEVFKLLAAGVSGKEHHYRFRNRMLKNARYKVEGMPAGGWDFSTALIYPMLEGPDVRPFAYDCGGKFHIIPYRAGQTRMPIPLAELQKEHPALADYFAAQRGLMEQQSAKSRAMHRGGEFYALSKIGPYTFAPVMVAARDNTRFCSAVVGPGATPWGERKQTICVKHTIIISQDKDKNFISEDEAHYINGVLNSSIVVSYMHSTFKTNGFSLKKSRLFLPKFQPDSPLFRRLAVLSQAATLHPEQGEAFAQELTEAYLDLCRHYKGAER